MAGLLQIRFLQKNADVFYRAREEAGRQIYEGNGQYHYANYAEYLRLTSYLLRHGTAWLTDEQRKLQNARIKATRERSSDRMDRHGYYAGYSDTGHDGFRTRNW